MQRTCQSSASVLNAIAISPVCRNSSKKAAQLYLRRPRTTRRNLTPAAQSIRRDVQATSLRMNFTGFAHHDWCGRPQADECKEVAAFKHCGINGPYRIENNGFISRS